jgi:hypothetical protein
MAPRYSTGGNNFNDVRTYAVPYQVGEPDPNNNQPVREILRFPDNLDELNFALEDQTRHHQANLDRAIHENDWQIAPHGQTIRCVVRPTASGIHYQCLNPNIHHRVQLLANLDEFAELIGTPATWREAYRRIRPFLTTRFEAFINLPDSTDESIVQNLFQNLVLLISTSLGRYRYTGNCYPNRETSTIVGGILAHPEYDTRSRMDPVFVNENDVAYLASEVKTESSFPDGTLYYRGTRGTQTFVAMYANNCPTVLLTTKKFKLVVENLERTQIFTYPSNLVGPQGEELSTYMRSTAMGDMDDQFIKVIVISLMAPRPNQGREESVEEAKEESKEKVNQVERTPVKPKTAPNLGDFTVETRRRSARFFGRPPTPTFISGFDAEGNAIRSEVRLYPQSVIEDIEREIENANTDNQGDMYVRPRTE